MDHSLTGIYEIPRKIVFPSSKELVAFKSRGCSQLLLSNCSAACKSIGLANACGDAGQTWLALEIQTTFIPDFTTIN